MIHIIYREVYLSIQFGIPTNPIIIHSTTLHHSYINIKSIISRYQITHQFENGREILTAIEYNKWLLSWCKHPDQFTFDSLSFSFILWFSSWFMSWSVWKYKGGGVCFHSSFSICYWKIGWNWAATIRQLWHILTICKCGSMTIPTCACLFSGINGWYQSTLSIFTIKIISLHNVYGHYPIHFTRHLQPVTHYQPWVVGNFVLFPSHFKKV